jgi:hypothetical protein
MPTQPTGENIVLLSERIDRQNTVLNMTKFDIFVCYPQVCQMQVYLWPSYRAGPAQQAGT